MFTCLLRGGSKKVKEEILGLVRCQQVKAIATRPESEERG